MPRSLLRALMPLLVTIHLSAQTPRQPGPAIGLKSTPPWPIRKLQPDYSPEARNERIQGTVTLMVVVNEEGRAEEISVTRPLGYGLDERAEAAVEKWEFRPGTIRGIRVKTIATVEMNFRFGGIRFDKRAEEQRVAFNNAIERIGQANASKADVDRTVKSVWLLARQKFAPALYVAGTWKIGGEHGRKNREEGLVLIQQAAAKNYAPALYEIAIRRMEGRDLPLDFEKGIDEMRSASVRGNGPAQLFLGNRYQEGNGVPRDLKGARRNYLYCAAQGVAECQYRLGRLLYDAPDRKERDYLQAIAMFQLAADQGVAEAAQITSTEAAKLTAEQTEWVASLKRQIVRQ